jgi:hypothetical protein
MELSCQHSPLFELVGWFEVAWRNNIDRAICAGRRPDIPHWLFDRAFPLQPTTWAKVAKAIKSVRRGTSPLTAGQVIAELSLGFWRFTASGYRQTVWLSFLSHAFPHAPRRRVRPTWIVGWTRLSSCATGSRTMSRWGSVAQVCRRVEDMLAIGSWISPDMAAWWRDRTSVWQVLARRPAHC